MARTIEMNLKINGIDEVLEKVTKLKEELEKIQDLKQIEEIRNMFKVSDEIDYCSGTTKEVCCSEFNILDYINCGDESLEEFANKLAERIKGLQKIEN